ncbi:MAG: heat-shock protein [Acidimicrobiaceae bacterium TMED130]|nr:MAG: heat-shock protein [Acidimicrobiaceae bacterium TMED130]|tara:strand:- start:2630 stop:3067 length:438 start_codon:yes stop_codon:yes gene_type:complete
MTTSTLSLFNKLRPVSVGFDSVFDHFESMFNDLPTMHTNYPPYDIVKTDQHSYVIELAVAGFSKKDISVTVENGVLTVESNREGQSETNDEEIIHRGISKRYFKKSFSISDDVEIRGAELKDGLLRVSMDKIIPESRKRKEINIS